MVERLEGFLNALEIRTQYSLGIYNAFIEDFAHCLKCKGHSACFQAFVDLPDDRECYEIHCNQINLILKVFPYVVGRGGRILVQRIVIHREFVALQSQNERLCFTTVIQLKTFSDLTTDGNCVPAHHHQHFDIQFHHLRCELLRRHTYRLHGGLRPDEQLPVLGSVDVEQQMENFCWGSVGKVPHSGRSKVKITTFEGRPLEELAEVGDGQVSLPVEDIWSPAHKRIPCPGQNHQSFSTEKSALVDLVAQVLVDGLHFCRDAATKGEEKGVVSTGFVKRDLDVVVQQHQVALPAVSHRQPHIQVLKFVSDLSQVQQTAEVTFLLRPHPFGPHVAEVEKCLPLDESQKFPIPQILRQDGRQPVSAKLLTDLLALATLLEFVHEGEAIVEGFFELVGTGLDSSKCGQTERVQVEVGEQVCELLVGDPLCQFLRPLLQNETQLDPGDLDEGVPDLSLQKKDNQQGVQLTHLFCELTLQGEKEQAQLLQNTPEKYRRGKFSLRNGGDLHLLEVFHPLLLETLRDDAFDLVDVVDGLEVRVVEEHLVQLLLTVGCSENEHQGCEATVLRFDADAEQSLLTLETAYEGLPLPSHEVDVQSQQKVVVFQLLERKGVSLSLQELFSVGLSQLQENAVGEDRTLHRQFPSYCAVHHLSSEDLFEDRSGGFGQVESFFGEECKEAQEKEGRGRTIANLRTPFPHLLPVVRSPLLYLLAKTVKIKPALRIVGREVLATVTVKDFIVFLLRVRVGSQMDRRVLPLERWVCCHHHETQRNLQVVEDFCVLQEGPWVLQELFVAISPIRIPPFHDPDQQTQIRSCLWLQPFQAPLQLLLEFHLSLHLQLAEDEGRVAATQVIDCLGEDATRQGEVMDPENADSILGGQLQDTVDSEWTGTKEGTVANLALELVQFQRQQHTVAEGVLLPVPVKHLFQILVQFQFVGSLPVPAAEVILRASHLPASSPFREYNFLEGVGKGVKLDRLPLLEGVAEEAVGLLAAHPPHDASPPAPGSVAMQAATPQIVFQVLPCLKTGRSERVLQRQSLENALEEVLQKGEGESIATVASIAQSVLLHRDRGQQDQRSVVGNLLEQVGPDANHDQKIDFAVSEQFSCFLPHLLPSISFQRHHHPSLYALHPREELHYPNASPVPATQYSLKVGLRCVAATGEDGEAALGHAGPAESFDMTADVDLLIEEGQDEATLGVDQRFRDHHCHLDHVFEIRERGLGSLTNDLHCVEETTLVLELADQHLQLPFPPLQLSGHSCQPRPHSLAPTTVEELHHQSLASTRNSQQSPRRGECEVLMGVMRGRNAQVGLEGVQFMLYLDAGLTALDAVCDSRGVGLAGEGVVEVESAKEEADLQRHRQRPGYRNNK